MQVKSINMRRINLKWFVIICFGLLLTACDNPLPPSKLAYEGVWRSEYMTLMITRQGQVSYERKEGAMTTSINGPIKEFTKNGFMVGFGFMTSEFIVNQKPSEQNGDWTMIVDGVKLTRTNQLSSVKKNMII